METWSEKTKFLRSTVEKKSFKENINPIISLKKKDSFSEYFLEKESGERVQICSSFLSKLLQISTKKIYRAATSGKSNPSAIDMRGNYIRKSNFRDIEFLKEFIRGFPSYESYHSSMYSTSKYLHPRLNRKKMYEMYVKWCNKQNHEVLSESIFGRILRTCFNYDFIRRSKQPCKTCKQNETRKLVRSVAIQEKQSAEQKKHIDTALNVKNEFIDSINHALESADKIEIYTFKLQRALELPQVKDEDDIYCKKSLWFYNFCVYDELRKEAHMYVWDESVASHGSQEIGSCLFKHFINKVPKDAQKVILYSDPFSGQNRNFKLTLMLQRLCKFCQKNGLISIEQRFFVPGHTQSSCDRILGAIEQRMYSTETKCVPKDLIDVIRNSRKNESEFTITEMKKNDFFSTKPLEEFIVHPKFSVNNEKIDWSAFQKIIYSKDDQFSFDVKEYCVDSAAMKTISFQNTGNVEMYLKKKFKYLYTEPRPISKDKYDDLQEILKFIPTEHHEFYKSLKYTESGQYKDFALAARDSSDEEGPR